MNEQDIIDRIKDIYASSSLEEQQILRQILVELSQDGYSKTYHDIWLADYKEIPVSIDTFLTSDTYLGKTNRNGAAVYPFWRRSLKEFFGAGNRYQEWILTGATRIGKSTTAVTAISYMLYRLMCLRNPQVYFGLKDISKISILFFNITLDLAKGVAFREFNDTLRESPWFNAHGEFSKSELNYIYIPEGGKISIDFGSSGSQALGKQVFCAIMDEMNFSQAGIKDVEKAKQRMKNTYDTVVARVRGTFKHGGEVFGKLFAVSSKNSDSDFLESYVQKQLESGAGYNMYISDAPQWEVKPRETFSKETFYIAVGDRNRRGFVVPENQCFPEALEELRELGYRLLTPPMDMRSDFLADFEIALRDLAGIAVVGSLSFITQDAINQCITSTRRNPFWQEILTIGAKDNYSIEEFFHVDDVPDIAKRAEWYIHLDLSKNTDRTGISAACITGRKDIENATGKISVPMLTHVFSVAIEAPRGDKIAYNKILIFLCWLRKQGFHIAEISRDQFQSEYLAELLEGNGFSTSLISLDRTPDGYIALRSMLIEQRVDMLDMQLLQDELVHLQRDGTTGRVDHPVGGCFTDDTEVQLVDGRTLSIRELLVEQEYKTNWVYTVNESTLRIEPKPIKKVFKTKYVKQLTVVTLDNGAVIRCTPDHRFMLRDGSFVEAHSLICGTSLKSIQADTSVHSISIVNRSCSVYDIEVEDNHNFALAAGCFVHNSKDVADSFAGCLWNASRKNPSVPVPKKSVINAISAVNGQRSPYNSLPSMMPFIKKK